MWNLWSTSLFGASCPPPVCTRRPGTGRKERLELRLSPYGLEVPLRAGGPALPPSAPQGLCPYLPPLNRGTPSVTDSKPGLRGTQREQLGLCEHLSADEGSSSLGRGNKLEGEKTSTGATSPKLLCPGSPGTAPWSCRTEQSDVQHSCQPRTVGTALTRTTFIKGRERDEYIKSRQPSTSQQAL